MKNILRLVKYAKPYWHLLVISAVSIVAITLLNLIGPRLIMRLIDILTDGFSRESLGVVRMIRWNWR